MAPRFRNRFAIGAAVLAAAAFAGGAYAANQSGSSSRQAFIDDVAKRLNVTPDQLRAALKAAMIDRINAAVSDGRLTQAQANAIEQRLNEGKLPLFFGLHRGFEHRFRHARLAAAASYLGLTDAQLFDQLRSGKSLAQIAKERGKTTSGLEQAMTAAFKARLDRAVAAGVLTAQQEQAILKRFQSRLDRMVNRTPRFGELGRMHPMPDGPPGMLDGPPGMPGGPPGMPGGPPPPGA